MYNFAELAAEYFCRVEAHIYGSNDIRSDMWMSRDEKQEAIRELDKKRTIAHDALIKAYNEHFEGAENRTQLADNVAKMIFSALGKTPSSTTEGSARDEIAELIHKKEIDREVIVKILESA